MKLVVIVGFVVASATVAAAQPAAQSPVLATQPSSAVATPARDICIVGNEHCKSILLLENTFGIKPVVAARTGHEFGLIDFTLEAGLLLNTGNRQGFGGSIGLHWVDGAEALPYVFRGRYRRWLSPGWNADVAPGFMLANVKRGGTGGTLQLSLERSGRIAFVMDIDIYHSSRDTSQTVLEVGLGVKFCGFWSLPTSLVTLLFAAALRGSG
jgi:hypothetical protein